MTPLRSQAAAVALGCLLAGSANAGGEGNDLAQAVQRAQGGDCAGAVATLDGIATSLRADAAQVRHLAQAYAHLAAAHLTCAQEASARAVLGNALRADAALKLAGAAATPELAAMLAALRAEMGQRPNGGATAWAFTGLSAAALGVGGWIAGERLGRNDAPILGAITATPTLGLASVTSISFSAAASDREGDPITYAWDLGDGTGAATATVDHVYLRSGKYRVRLEATDGRHVVASDQLEIVIRDLSGTWRGTMAALPDFTLRLVQEGTALSGTFTQNRREATLISGKVIAPATMQFAFPHDLHIRLIECTLDARFDSCAGTHRPPETAVLISR